MAAVPNTRASLLSIFGNGVLPLVRYHATHGHTMTRGRVTNMEAPD